MTQSNHARPVNNKRRSECEEKQCSRMQDVKDASCCQSEVWSKLIGCAMRHFLAGPRVARKVSKRLRPAISLSIFENQGMLWVSRIFHGTGPWVRVGEWRMGSWLMYFMGDKII